MSNNLAPKYMRPEATSVGSNTDMSGFVSDDDLLMKIAEGDRHVFAILMKRYLGRMVVLAQRIVFDKEQAQEIAQEAFLSVWQYAPKWKSDGSATFLTWLHRVVINLSISRKRRSRDHVTLDVIEELPSDTADGFDSIVASDKKRVVREALEKLPQRQRAAIALYYFENFSQTHAAEIMEMTPSAFDSLIVRARVNMKKYLTDFGFQDQGDLS